MRAVEAALYNKFRSTRRLRELTGLPLPRIRRALRELERQGRASSGRFHYNLSGRGALAHAPGWRKVCPMRSRAEGTPEREAAILARQAVDDAAHERACALLETLSLAASLLNTGCDVSLRDPLRKSIERSEAACAAYSAAIQRYADAVEVYAAAPP